MCHKPCQGNTTVTQAFRNFQVLRDAPKTKQVQTVPESGRQFRPVPATNLMGSGLPRECTLSFTELFVANDPQATVATGVRTVDNDRVALLEAHRGFDRWFDHGCLFGRH